MFLSDDQNLYIKFPKAMGSAIIKAIIQSIISLKYDQRSDPQRLDAAEFILLQLANEIGNTEKITEEKANVINYVFEPSQKEETDE